MIDVEDILSTVGGGGGGGAVTTAMITPTMP